MFSALFDPWRRARAWWATADSFLNLPVGVISFSVIVTLLSTGGGLLITFFLALPFVWLLFVCAKGFGTLERSRVRALLGVELASPHAPLRPGSWGAHLKERVTTRSRWKEIAYFLVLLPFGIFTFVLAAVAWCGSLAMIGLPFYVNHLPGATAKFWLFELGSGTGAWLALAAGVVGLVLWAPWLAVGLAAIHGALARGLLGPNAARQLEAQVTRLEASRVAAVDSAESERRRIERDLHDGAQQRLVALAMDLGRARERFDTDPDQAMALVADAHDEAKAALADLRSLVRGIHPAILTDRGLDASLRRSWPARRCPSPSTSTWASARRRRSSTAYFVVKKRWPTWPSTRTPPSVRRHRAPGRPAVTEISDNGVGADPDRQRPAVWRSRRRPRRPHARPQPGRWPDHVIVELRAHRDRRRRRAARQPHPPLVDAGEDVVAAVGDGDALLVAVERHQPDLAIVDVRMPPSHTDEACEPPSPSARWPNVSIPVFSQYVEERYATTCWPVTPPASATS
jgi:signal transduction histidine kinase/CheY-like chemotaxis protein